MVCCCMGLVAHQVQHVQLNRQAAILLRGEQAEQLVACHPPAPAAASSTPHDHQDDSITYAYQSTIRLITGRTHQVGVWFTQTRRQRRCRLTPPGTRV
jgi:hypothetical protein